MSRDDFVSCVYYFNDSNLKWYANGGEGVYYVDVYL